jgi:PKD repeat protein
MRSTGTTHARPLRRGIPAILAAAAGLIAAGCHDDPTRPIAPNGLRGPRLAVDPIAARTPWTPTLASDGYHYIVGTFATTDAGGNPTTKVAAKACDVWIGEDPTVFPAGAEPKKFPHQLLVRVNPGAKLKLGMPAPGVTFAAQPQPFPAGIHEDAVADSKFTCDAMEPGTTEVVVDPVTAHAAKGDGPKLFTGGVSLDLNGMSIRADPRHGDNLGVVLAGVANTLTNSHDGAVSTVSGFGHNIELEAESPKVIGKLVTVGGVARENIETPGGLGVRLSSGDVEVAYVRSIDYAVEAGAGPVGVGFEIRRCTGGTANIHDNHFVGSGEGVLIRECGTAGRPGQVVLRNNFISSPGGVGVNTREAVGSTIDNNVIDLAYPGQDLVGPTGIAWALGSDALKITKNTIRNYHKHAVSAAEPANVCGVEITSGNRIPDADALTAANTIDVPPAGSAARQVCGAPANAKPVAGFTSSCPTLECTLTSTSTDADGTVASYRWNFGDGTPVVTTTAPSTKHTFAAAGTYAVELVVTDNRGGASAPTTNNVTTSAVAANAAPTAAFDWMISGFTAKFTDQSSDSDGRVAQWSWSFGDGGTSTAQHPTRKYDKSGTYLVRLTATDERGKASAPKEHSLTIVSPTITLSATGLSSGGSRRVDLRWSDASGPDVIVYRLRGTGDPTTPLLTTPDDGQHVDSGVSKGTWTYKVCSAHDGRCSDRRAVTFQ